MKKLFCFLLLLFLLQGCGKDKAATNTGAVNVLPPPVVNTPVYEKKEPPKYVYKGDKYRDPFVSLTGAGRTFNESEEAAAPNVGTLSLKGIMAEGKVKIALITGDGGTFILKESRLYDNRQRHIKGITGAIKKDSVIMISPDGSSKELKLREN